MKSINPQGLAASIVGSGLALALAFTPTAPSAQTTPNGAVTPAAAPGQFSNSPTTTGPQGGQESVTTDDQGHVRAIGRSTFAPTGGVTVAHPTASPKPSKGKVHNGVYVAPQSTLPPQP